MENMKYIEPEFEMMLIAEADVVTLSTLDGVTEGDGTVINPWG